MEPSPARLFDPSGDPLDPLPRLLRNLAEMLDGGPMRLLIERGGVRAELTVRAVTDDDDTPATTPELDGKPGLQQIILDLLSAADRPMKACVIAMKLGRSNSPYLRRTLSIMRKNGILAPAGDDPGYMLAEKPEEPEEEEARKSTPLEKAIVEVLCSTDHPLKGVLIARRLDRNCDPYLRRTLARMVSEGILIKPDDAGYWLADRPVG